MQHLTERERISLLMIRGGETDKGHTIMLGSSSMQRSGIKIQVSRNLQFTKQFDVSKKLVALKTAQKQEDQQQQQIPRSHCFAILCGESP